MEMFMEEKVHDCLQVLRNYSLFMIPWQKSDRVHVKRFAIATPIFVRMEVKRKVKSMLVETSARGSCRVIRYFGLFPATRAAVVPRDNRWKLTPQSIRQIALWRGSNGAYVRYVRFSLYSRTCRASRSQATIVSRDRQEETRSC